MVESVRTKLIAVALCATVSVAFPVRADNSLTRAFEACGAAANNVLLFQCEDRALGALEARLTQAYNAALERTRVYERTTMHAPPLADSLLPDSQRTWNAFREAECAMVADANSAGGSAHHEELLDCRFKMVTSRVEELEKLYR